MFSILSSNSAPHYLKQLRDQFVMEWGDIDPFEGTHAGVAIPAPLLALDEQHCLVGGLAFTSSNKPRKNEIGVWINALLVAPEYRRMGIASKLIQSAAAESMHIKVKEIFVQTDIPSLYQHQGWYLLENSGTNSVLAKSLR